ncbi:unnamed protein product [Blepharisma stoltei]|uniref:Uncharacterized protein n=1 Tax=Blepharisma stoltei TaxID=1481888 RepID=A0AAU9K5G8_9CILI|nr:unnamed protein product [Blepharisma stoltei]
MHVATWGFLPLELGLDESFSKEKQRSSEKSFFMSEVSARAAANQRLKIWIIILIILMYFLKYLIKTDPFSTFLIHFEKKLLSI